jgi:hypothetical protein
MAIDQNPQGRRGGHFNRGRRSPDRRGTERRPPPPPDQNNRGEQRGERSERVDRVDVEQIMRDIRARISQRSGVELSNQQIQELASRRLEAILDPRALKPGLLDQLRRAAGERQTRPDAAQPPGPVFEEASLYDSPRAVLRFFRKLLNPILRLFFNPTPVAHALAVQGRLSAEAAARETDRDRRQTEWNALHYEILQRLVTEIARGSIEAQSLSLRVESLGAKVDFNDRRVRSFEGTQQVRAPRPQDAASFGTPAPPQPAASASQDAPVAEIPATPAEGQPGQPGPPSGDAPRRRRRRRRGRRGAGPGGAPAEGTGSAPSAAGASEAEQAEQEGDTDNGFDDEPETADAMTNDEAPMERQAAPETPLDHRLPEPAANHEESHPSPTPARNDSEPGPSET